MNVETLRFGTIEFEEDEVLLFPEGILGFEECKRYVVLQHGECSPFFWLQSLDRPEVAFLVADPAGFEPTYAPEMPPGVAQLLRLDENTPRLVYAILSIPHGKPKQMTANLAGPIVVNVAERLACQVVVEDGQWSTKHPVFVGSGGEEQSASTAA
ncbi:MAG: hypothetical protein C4340_04800 [Armatimonadota bacterium]